MQKKIFFFFLILLLIYIIIIMLKICPHYVIRLRKGKRHENQVKWIIVILNKKRTNSQKIIDCLGYFKAGKKQMSCIDFERLSYYLNKGFILKKSVKKMIYFHTF